MLNRNLILKKNKQNQKKGNLEPNFQKIPYCISEGDCLDREFTAEVTALIHKNKFLLTAEARLV